MITRATLQMILSDLEKEHADRNCDVHVQQNTEGRYSSTSRNQPEIRADDTEHMKIFTSMVEFYNRLGAVANIKVEFNWEWRKSKLFWFMMFALANVWNGVIYTLIVHIRNKDYTRMLEPLSLVGWAMGATHKLLSAIQHFNKMIALMVYFRNICKNTTNGCSRSTILTDGLARNTRFMKMFVIGLTFSLLAATVAPIKMYFVNDLLVTMAPFLFQYLDPSSIEGFLIANSIEIILGIYGAWAVMIYGLTFITLVMNYNILAELLAEDFKDLDEMWSGGREASLVYKHAFLKNVCMKRQDMNDYLNVVKTVYEDKLFYYFIYSYLSLVVCMFHTIVNHWDVGWGALCGFFYEMIFYCFNGKEISVADDRICHVIYNNNWYNYDAVSQKMILLMLKEAQVSKEMEIRFVGPLNLVTFVTIAKSVYSYYTVLTELL